MEFFRHDTDAGQGRFLTEAIEKFGHFGYTGFFLLCEMYYKKLDVSNKSEIRKSVRIVEGKSKNSPSEVQLWYGFHWRVVRQSLRTTPVRVRHLLDYCQTSGVLLWDESPTGIEISVCNILELLPDTIRRRLDSVLKSVLEKRIEENRREENTIEEERKKEPVQAKPEPLPKLALIWNEYCGELSKVKNCNPSRRKKCNTRYKEIPGQEGTSERHDHWVSIIQRIVKSDFCTGKNDRGWVATFDWLLQCETHLKVDEGKFDNRNKVNQTRARKVSDNNKELWNKIERGEV